MTQQKDLKSLKVTEYIRDKEGLAEKLIAKGEVVATAWASNPRHGKAYEVEFNNMLFRVNPIGFAVDEIVRLR